MSFDRLLEGMIEHPLRTLLVCLAWSVFKAGLWLVPSIEHIVAMSADLRRVMVPDGMHWIYGSFLGPVLAHVLGLTDRPIAFGALNLAIAVAAFIGCGMAIERRFGKEYCVLYGLLFAAAPISNPLFNWLGYADAVTFAMFTAIVISRAPWVCFLLAIAMAWNHFEQSLAFLAIYVLFAHTAGFLKQEQSKLLAVGAAIVLTKTALTLYFTHAGMELQMSRFSYSVDHPDRLRHLLINFLSNPLVLAWSLFSGAWLYIWTFFREGSAAANVKKAALLSLLVCLVPVFVVADATRVFAMLSWPVLLLTILKPVPAWWATCRKAVFSSMCIAALIPQIIVWDGWIYSSATLHTAYFAKRYWMDGERKITTERVRKPFVNNSAHLRSKSSPVTNSAAACSDHTVPRGPQQR